MEKHRSSSPPPPVSHSERIIPAGHLCVSARKTCGLEPCRNTTRQPSFDGLYDTLTHSHLSDTDIPPPIALSRTTAAPTGDRHCYSASRYDCTGSSLTYPPIFQDKLTKDRLQPSSTLQGHDSCGLLGYHLQLLRSNILKASLMGSAQHPPTPLAAPPSGRVCLQHHMYLQRHSSRGCSFNRGCSVHSPSAGSSAKTGRRFAYRHSSSATEIVLCNSKHTDSSLQHIEQNSCCEGGYSTASLSVTGRGLLPATSASSAPPSHHTAVFPNSVYGKNAFSTSPVHNRTDSPLSPTPVDTSFSVLHQAGHVSLLHPSHSNQPPLQDHQTGGRGPFTKHVWAPTQTNLGTALQGHSPSARLTQFHSISTTDLSAVKQYNSLSTTSDLSTVKQYSSLSTTSDLSTVKQFNSFSTASDNGTVKQLSSESLCWSPAELRGPSCSLAPADGVVMSVGPVAVRRRSSAQRLERLYSYEDLNRKRPCNFTPTDEPPHPNKPPTLSSEQDWRAAAIQQGAAVGVVPSFFTSLPLEVYLIVGYYLTGDDLGRMCCVNKEWHYTCTILQQPLWQQLVLKKYGFKYENYMLYTQLNDWHLMYAKANTFLKNLKTSSPLISSFPSLLLPPIPGYQGSLAMTADCSTLLWENGEYLQAVDVNEGVTLYCVPVQGPRNQFTSHPCLVNTQTKIFLHLNKEIKVFCLATGALLGVLEVPLGPDETDWEPNDFSLDVSIRNQQVTFLAREALHVFDSETLKFVYRVVHKEVTAEEGATCKDIDFLWAGYHCSSATQSLPFNRSSPSPHFVGQNRRHSIACGCGGPSSMCRRKSRHIITWLRKAGRNIKVFDVCTGNQIMELEGHEHKVLRVRQAQNVQRLEDYFLASLDVSGVVRLWDSSNKNFQCIYKLDASASSLSTRNPTLPSQTNTTSSHLPSGSEGITNADTPMGTVGDATELQQTTSAAGSRQDSVNTTFRLSFSSTHLMTMSECRGHTIRVHSDGPHGGQVDREVQKAIVLKIWTFDPFKLSEQKSIPPPTRPRMEGLREAASVRERPLPGKFETIHPPVYGMVFCPENSEPPPSSGMEVGLAEDAPSSPPNPRQLRGGRTRSESPVLTCRGPCMVGAAREYFVTPHRELDPPVAGGSASPTEREECVLEECGNFVLPDNSYFADFLDNQLVGVWLSHSTHEMDFSSTLSDWRVFNCLQPGRKASDEGVGLRAVPEAACIRQGGGDGCGRLTIDVRGLKDSYAFNMNGRGDIWTLLDWKCISISPSGDLIVYDFCPIADAAKKKCRGLNCLPVA